MLGRDVGQLGLAPARGRSRDGDVGLLQGYLAGALGRRHRGVYPLAKLGRAYEEQVPLLLAGDEDVVLVLALLLGVVAECRHAVAVLAIVKPLALVAQTVAALGDAEARALVVLPLAKVCLGYGGVHLLILLEE